MGSYVVEEIAVVVVHDAVSGVTQTKSIGSKMELPGQVCKKNF